MSATSCPPSMRRLIHELSKLPSIGEKSALRLAYHLLMRDRSESIALADAIREARERTALCEECFALCEGPRCAICTDPKRDRTVLCVVEKPADVMAIERGGRFRGLFHVLHGLWSPMRGVGPERTRIGELVERIKRLRLEDPEQAAEVVLATSATVEGDATAMYIARLMRDLGVRPSRIAQGLPKGGELEYADDLTLSHALEGRRSLEDR